MVNVRELLDAKGIDHRQAGDGEIAIICPNAASHQGGQDNKPSFSINSEKLVGNCLACGFSMGSRKFVKWLYGEDIDEDQLEALALKTKLEQLNEKEKDNPFAARREIFIPPGKAWDEDGFRGISLDTYQRLGALHCTRGRYSDRIVFPIYVNGELKGIDARALADDLKPKYLRNAKSSCKTDWLYPYDIVRTAKPDLVIIGEGIFHAINALDKGFYGLCFFGAHNWSLNKLRMLLATGAREICFFRDKDKEGAKSEQMVCSQLSDYIEVSAADVSEVPDGKDLGDLTHEQIQDALDNRAAPALPECMLGDQPGQPDPGECCRHKHCPYNHQRQCLNFYWK